MRTEQQWQLRRRTIDPPTSAHFSYFSRTFRSRAHRFGTAYRAHRRTVPRNRIRYRFAHDIEGWRGSYRNFFVLYTELVRKGGLQGGEPGVDISSIRPVCNVRSAGWVLFLGDPCADLVPWLSASVPLGLARARALIAGLGRGRLAYHLMDMETAGRRSMDGDEEAFISSTRPRGMWQYFR